MTSYRPLRSLMLPLALGLALSACAANTSSTALPAPAIPAATPALGELKGLDQLEALPLKSKECGMFLWPAHEKGNLVFHGDLEAKSARIQLAGRQFNLAMSPSGEIAEQGSLDIGLAAPAEALSGNLKVSVAARQDNMVVLSSGLLKLSQGSDWRVAVPVTGFMGCQD